MLRSRVARALLIALFVAPLALLEIACSRHPEQQFLTQFFRAARARDNTTLGMMSAVTFDPRERGTVSDFEITAVTPEQRSALDLKGFVDAARKAREAELEFSKRKKVFQDANLTQIEQLIKVERDPTAKMTPALEKIKPEWDKWRAETSTFTMFVSGVATSTPRAATSIRSASAKRRAFA